MTRPTNDDAKPVEIEASEFHLLLQLLEKAAANLQNNPVTSEFGRQLALAYRGLHDKLHGATHISVRPL